MKNTPIINDANYNTDSCRMWPENANNNLE